MKYYSEKLSKIFDTEDALHEAEEVAVKEQEAKEATKKELADAIESADAALEAAHKRYAEVKKEVEAIARDTNKCIAEMLRIAKEDITTQEKKRTEAIVDFNNKFGTYKAVYNGDRAKREAARVQNLIDSMFNWTLF